MQEKRIKKLSEQVIRKIAAGEVIQRPSSALKELIENSLDAGSTYIKIHLKKEGMNMLRVIDNGCGIQFQDLPRLCERFTTSKLSKYSDLKKITTFGFRGEALSSISYVSHITVITQTRGSQIGYKAEYKNGELVQSRSQDKKTNQDDQIKIIPVASIPGTQIDIENLFYNQPSRLRSFQKNNQETQKILHIVRCYSINNPQVNFIVTQEEKKLPLFICKYSFNANSLERIQEIYSIFVQKSFLNLQINTIIDQSFLLQLEGCVSNLNYFNKVKDSEKNIKKSNFILFINQRLVENKKIKIQINKIYKEILKTKDHPFIFLNLILPPECVDVNIHPSKKQVQFLQEDLILATIMNNLKTLLMNHLCEDQKEKENKREEKLNNLKEKEREWKTTIKKKTGKENEKEKEKEEDKKEKDLLKKNIKKKNTAKQVKKNENKPQQSNEQIRIRGPFSPFLPILQELPPKNSSSPLLRSTSAYNTDNNNFDNKNNKDLNGLRIPSNPPSLSSSPISLMPSLVSSPLLTSSSCTFSLSPIVLKKKTNSDQSRSKDNSFLTISLKKNPLKSSQTNKIKCVPQNKNLEESVNNENNLDNRKRKFEFTNKQQKNNENTLIPYQMEKQPKKIKNINQKTSFAISVKNKIEPKTLTSLRQNIESPKNSQLAKILKEGALISILEADFALIQYQSGLYLFDIEILVREFLYQYILRNCHNLKYFEIKNGISMDTMLNLGLNSRFGGWNKGDGDKKEIIKRKLNLIQSKKKELLNYFSIKIGKNETIRTLPVLIPEYFPDLKSLPMFILQLGIEAERKSEQQFFESFAFEIALYYTPIRSTDFYQFASQNEKKAFIHHENIKLNCLFREKIFPFLQKEFIATDTLNEHIAVVQIAQVDDFGIIL
ncbi:DNA mismatch repair protein mlh1 [Anaeramoeba flamelloides]|uniref:DNA mismatch repair protein mlh1 n=1 Tax=Anaeramoeba flamelloides TaxID=1746091 RepID=A0ABQ8XP40_9EUKA|nr:DNA mismatch repair protein mlh1 [Anaeramoeba flamelloides]